jgi:hypothetical protein
MSISDAAAHFRAIGDEWRDPAKASLIVERYVSAYRFMDLTGRVPPFELRTGVFYDADFIVNNQSTFPIAQIRFGGGSLIGYCPWHSSHEVHIVPSMEPHGPDAEPVQVSSQ